MNFKKIMSTAIAGVMTMGLLVGCGSSSTSTTSAGAGKDGYPDLKGKKLSVYVSFHDDMAKRLIDMFQEKTGCDVSYIRMPTGESFTRITAEKDDPKADIIIGGTADAQELMKQKKLITKYESKNEKDIPKEFSDKDGTWKGLYLEVLSIGVNSERFKKEFEPKGIKMPKTLEDLTNPAFKGEIIMPDPNTSGTGLTFVASVLKAMGKEKGMEYLKKLKPNIAQLTKSGFTPAQKVGAGEFLITVNFVSDQLIIKNSGFPMETEVYDKAGWTIVPVGKIANCKNSEAADAFIDFTLSKEAGDALVELSNAPSVRSDVNAPKGGKKLSELPINKEYNFLDIVNSKDELLKLFNSIK